MFSEQISSNPISIEEDINKQYKINGNTLSIERLINAVKESNTEATKTRERFIKTMRSRGLNDEEIDALIKKISANAEMLAKQMINKV